MRVIKKLHPGVPGTLRYQEFYKDRLVCVRYRDDVANQRRITTVELIVDERLVPRPRSELVKTLFPHPNQYVLVRIGHDEVELQEKLKAVGGRWQAYQKWKVLMRHVLALGLEERIDSVLSNKKNT